MQHNNDYCDSDWKKTLWYWSRRAIDKRNNWTHYQSSKKNADYFECTVKITADCLSTGQCFGFMILKLVSNSYITNTLTWTKVTYTFNDDNVIMCYNDNNKKLYIYINKTFDYDIITVIVIIMIYSYDHNDNINTNNNNDW